MERVRDSMSSAHNWWADLRPASKLAILAVALALVGAAFVVHSATRPSYGLLYTELQPEDFNKVVNWLNTNDVKFEAMGSDTIMVLEEHVIATRAQMAQEGIPSSGNIVGKEDLERSSFSETRAQFQKRVQRMVEGEVTRTVRLFDEVKNVKINIAFPEQEPLFEEDRVPLTAAVSLEQTNPNVELTPATVDAIANVVANSVSGLEPERVAIVDSRGRRYHASEARPGVDPAVVAAQENQRRERETELEEELHDAIAGIAGDENARVVASIDLDWGDETTKKRELLPDPETGRGFLISRENETEEYSGPGPTGGVPGVEANVPTTPEGAPPTYPVTENQPLTYSRSNSKENLDYGLSETEKTNPPPTVTRKSVGVFLNAEAVTAGDQARIEQVLSSMAGIEVARGDLLVVQRVPFAEEEVVADAGPTNRWMRMLVPIIVLLFGIFVPAAIGRMTRPPEPPPVEEIEEEAPIEGLPWEGLIDETPSEIELLRQEEQRRTEEAYSQVRRLAEERPEDFASALRAWLVEE